MERSQAPGVGRATDDCADLSGKYLTFKLGSEVYGLRILKVQEIIGMMAVTPVPKAPRCVRGVINLRGKVIPVVALRSKFDMPVAEDDEKTCIIVVQVSRRDDVDLTMGILVDEVSEVIDIDAEQVEPTPQFASGGSTDFILGLGKLDQRVVMLLDVDRVMSEEKHMALEDDNAVDN